MKPIAVISKNKNQYSETFIHDHVQKLPFDVHFLYGDYLPHSVVHRWGGLERELEKKPEKRPGAISKYFRKNRIECVLAEYGPSGVEMSQICSAMKIPLVVHFHGYDAFRNDILSGYGASYPELFRCASAIVAVSHDMVTTLTKLGADRKKIQFIPYGVDTEIFREVDCSRNPPTFLTVGRAVEKKGHAGILLAFRRHLETNPDSLLEMVGDGHLLPSLRMLAKTLGINRQVVFHGRKNRREVREAIAGARALIQFSHVAPDNDSEGLPLAVLEALSSAVPVIGSRHGGIPDVVGEGANGYLVNEWDWQGLAGKMDLLARDPRLASHLGHRGAALIRSRYTMERYISELTNLI